MKKEKETKIKDLKTESIIAFMVLSIVLVMTICSTLIEYSLNMDTAKAETITDLSGTIWTFNDTISELIPNQNYYINFYWLDEEDDPATQTDCTKIRMYVNSAQTQKLLQYDTNTTVYIWQINNPSIPTGWNREDVKTIYIQDGEDATNTTFIAWLQQNATQVIETVDYTPQIEEFETIQINAIIERYNTGTNTNIYNQYGTQITVFKVDNAEYAENNNSFTLRYTAYIQGVVQPRNGTFEGVIGDDGKGYIIIAIPNSTTAIELWYTDHSENKLLISSIETGGLRDLMVQNTSYLNALSNTYTQANYEYAYRTGYNAGMETDQTLLNVIWGTMQLPFNIIFGTYNNTTHTYDGGLFNFTILGINVRAFTLGLMSMAIILAIVKLILGNK